MEHTESEVGLGRTATGQGGHPLAEGQRRQDVVGEVSGHLHNAADGAGGADAAALAVEGDGTLDRSVVASDASEAAGQDAAAEIGAEVLFDPAGNAVAEMI